MATPDQRTVTATPGSRHTAGDDKSHQTDQEPQATPAGSRRRFLRRLVNRGAAVAGGVALAGVVDPAGASAADTDPLRLGLGNSASHETGLTVLFRPDLGGANPYGLAVTDNGLGAVPDDLTAAVLGHCRTQFGSGVVGYAETVGDGVRGVSTYVNGVLGRSSGTAGRGIHGSCDTAGGAGVEGVSALGRGVIGSGAVAGVHGTSSSFGGDFGGATAAVRARAGAGVHLMMDKGGSYTSGPHTAGSVLHAATGEVVCCVGSGTPGTFRVVASAASAGSLHFITPVRVYDSRPGTAPTGVTKGLLLTGTTRDVDCKLGSGVPASATGVMVTLTVTGTSAGGFLKAWGKGTTEPSTSVHNWDHESATAATTTTVRSGPSATISIRCGGTGASTHVLVDVIAYYR